MATEKRLIDDFKNEVMRKFIELCRGNDYNKLSLLKIGETIDRTFEKYRTLPTVDAVPVVRCKDCKHCAHDKWCERRTLFVFADDFCSYGERKDNG